jgi:cytochrome c biogenesis protein CcdA/thiol-disulfide isomerase/thioredoxin
MKKATLLLTLLLLIWTGLLPPSAKADEPVVRAVLFWSENCSHCHAVIAETLPPLQEQYGSQLDVRTIEVSDPTRYELWLSAIDTFQVPPERVAVPMLVIGDSVLVGSYEISEALPGLIEQHLAAGGLDYPAIPGLFPPGGLTPQPGTPTPQPVAHVIFFYDRLCHACTVVQEEVLPPLQEKYGSQLVIDQRDVEGSTSNYNLLRALERQDGVVYGDMPAVFIGQDALYGEEAVRERLPELIEQYLAQGGVPLPPVVSQETRTPDATPPAPTAEVPRPPIHLAYFYQPGCRECDRVQLDLNYLQHEYPQLVVHAFDVEAEAALAEWLGQRAGIPEERRLTAPAVFVGDEGLVGEEVHARSLEALIARHAATGAEAVWERREPSQSEAVSSIVERFRSFGLLTVLAAGLVDGLNPCAFATIVFFISYLAFAGRQRREILAVGAAFALGVFLTYLGVGVGLLRFLATLPFLSALSRWLYGLTAVLCLFLAVGSLYDWWQARRGEPDEMRLKLPTRLRRWINRVIREGARMQAFVPVTFVAGVVISAIELACTGQVYLPTILFVLSVPELQARAGVYLLLYNLMFVLPLLVVFLLAYFGTTSQQLGLFIHRRAATIKLATAGLFVLLAGWLVTALM